MDKIILTASNGTIKHTIELPFDAGIDDLFNSFKSLLIGLTWSNSTIDNHIVELADSYIPDIVLNTTH
ncbi:MAG: hypothetical protein ACOYLT_07445 [Flavobacterium sp.]|uniref:hypothetical protein n=1 Tax=Flavobacterium sp. TaxID=239 RepID=UPI003BE8C451